MYCIVGGGGAVWAVSGDLSRQLECRGRGAGVRTVRAGLEESAWG